MLKLPVNCINPLNHVPEIFASSISTNRKMIRYVHSENGLKNLPTLSVFQNQLLKHTDVFIFIKQ